MKLCTKHWTDLKAGIEGQGLMSLVATTGQEAGEMLVSELENGRKVTNFDPLMAANNAIFANAVEAGGLYLMTNHGGPENDGHFCPLCELVKHSKEGMDAQWIKGASEEMRRHAVELGLIKAEGA